MDLEGFLRVGTLAELEKRGCIVVAGDRQPIAVFFSDGKARAVDNRCPHLGFPLAKGTVNDGILTCHWHHARFDLACGGTLDPWADDVPSFAVRTVGDEVWVAGRPEARDAVARATARVREGLERDLALVLAKSAIALDQAGAEPTAALAAAVAFGVTERAEGWGAGMSILTMSARLTRHLRPEDWPLALYHGLVHLAADCAGHAPRFALPPLAARDVPLERLGRWLRGLIEVRDAQGAERVLATAVATGHPPEALAHIVLAAATDHPYLDGGHALDFVNKAFELLEILGFEAHAAAVLPALAGPLARAERVEEWSRWRSPVDLIELLRRAGERLPRALEAGARADGRGFMGREALAAILLADDPGASLEALETSLAAGATGATLAECVAYAAALRIARFPTSNEFGDWDTALHTFTYANAVLESVRRCPTPETHRAILDAAMSVWLDRFLNLPEVPLPLPAAVDPAGAAGLLGELGVVTNSQQQVDRAAALAAAYLATGAAPAALCAVLGALLLREDAHFHTIQATEAGFNLAERLGPATPAARAVLVAVSRYLAAHAPTSRVRGQTFRTAARLARGESLYEDEATREQAGRS